MGYIELYRQFIEDVKTLGKEKEEKEKEIRSLKEWLKRSTTPIILTEGKTDAALLGIAIRKLGKEAYKEWEIQQIITGKASSNDTLLRYLQELRDNMELSKLVIGMFDRDTKLELEIDRERIDIRTREYFRIAKNVYAFAIPVPHDRPEKDQISIEHYFTDEEIKTEIEGKRLFIGNEFYNTGVYKGNEKLCYKAAAKVADTIKIIEHETNCYVTNHDGTGDFSISKARFVDCIEQNKPGFSTISFEEFERIFDILEKIKKQAIEENENQPEVIP